MRETFVYRLKAEYLMILAWTITSPVLKTYYGLLDSSFFGIVSIWATVVGLSQKYLRKWFSINQLLTMSIIFDLIYILILTYFNIHKDIKDMLIFELVLDGPYMTVVFATISKLETYYLGRLKPFYQDRIRANIDNYRLWYSLTGLAIGTLLAMMINIYTLLWIKIMLIFIGIYLEYKSLRVFMKPLMTISIIHFFLFIYN